MAVSVPAQMLAFLAACAAGAALGILYDLFRIFRLIVPCGRGALFALDVLFLLLCAGATFLFLLTDNAGGIRLFLLEGELIGAVVYLLTASRLVMGAARALTAAARRSLHVCGERMRPPLRRFSGRIRSGLRAGAQKTGGLMKKAAQPVKIRLKPGWKVMYNGIHTWRRRHKGRPNSIRGGR